jgi:hypothetical protein
MRELPHVQGVTIIRSAIMYLAPAVLVLQRHLVILGVSVQDAEGATA